MAVRKHRLVFPEDGCDLEEAGEFAVQAVDDQGRAPALAGDVAGR